MRLPLRETKSKALLSSLGSPSPKLDPALSLFLVAGETLFANIGSGSDIVDPRSVSLTLLFASTNLSVCLVVATASEVKTHHSDSFCHCWRQTWSCLSD